MTKIGINSTVQITALAFGRNMAVLPKRMEWRGRIYDFIDHGVRTTIRQESGVCHTLTASDGINTFCLRQRAGIWTLLSIS